MSLGTHYCSGSQTVRREMQHTTAVVPKRCAARCNTLQQWFPNGAPRDATQCSSDSHAVRSEMQHSTVVVPRRCPAKCNTVQLWFPGGAQRNATRYSCGSQAVRSEMQHSAVVVPRRRAAKEDDYVLKCARLFSKNSEQCLSLKIIILQLIFTGF